jgi:predicted ATPase
VHNKHINNATGDFQMNVIQTLIARVEDYRATNKTPCKSYVTEAKAESVAKELSVKYGNYFAKRTGENGPCRYVVAYNEAWGRWIVGFDFSELLGRNSSTGGYIGIASKDGFFTY